MNTSPVLAWVTLAMVCAAPATGQTRDEDMPRDVVEAILSAVYGSAVDLQIGTVPSSLPPELIPSGATIVATVATSFGDLVIARVPEWAEEHAALYENRLNDKGWRSPVMDHNEGGFVSVSQSANRMFCREGRSASAFHTRSDNGAYFLKIMTARESSRGGPCGTEPSRSAHGHQATDIPLPTLMTPPGATLLNGGGGTSDDTVERHARLSSKMDGARVLEHYASQMIAQRWRQAAPLGSQELNAQRFRRTDDNGVSWISTLAVLRLETPEEFELSLRLVRPDPPRP